MKVIESNTVKKQFRKNKMPADVKKRIYEKIKRLHGLAAQKYQDLGAYLKSQNGKMLKGSKERHIYKFRLNEGDRLMYTFGKYVDGIREEDKNALLILECVTHDKQGLFKKLPQADAFSGEGLFAGIETAEEASAEDFADMEAGYDGADSYLKKFCDTHTLFVYDEELEKKHKYDDMDVYLSTEQSDYILEYLTNPKPTLILGGAGTGKTVMALHILHDFQGQNPNVRCAYFTHSMELLKKAEAKFDAISTNVCGEKSHMQNQKNVEFWDINEFCMERMNLKRVNHITYDKFCHFVEQDGRRIKELKKRNISIYDLWAEIQGTIKGGLDQDWHRADWVDWRKKEYNGQVMSELRKQHLIEVHPEDAHLFCLKQEACKLEASAVSIQTKKAIQLLREISVGVDTKMPLQRKDVYMKIAEENTTLEASDRAFLYEFCQNQYMDWIEKNGYFDENDLARRMLGWKGFEMKAYDLIVVDEIQDYTELQIYLIQKMAKQDGDIIMAGDSHQIVNPTMFREQRIRQLFGQQLQVCRLKKNFRSQDKIVEYTNALASLRRQKIGKTKNENEMEERAVIPGMEPVRMDYTDENIIQLIDKLLDYPDAVILVADEVQKQRIIDLYGEQKYAAKENRIIFTVAEIKGMEYRLVFCLNLVGSFSDIWKCIFQGEAKRKTKYRYYFNLIYVGASRSQEHLCIIEEVSNPDFEQFLQNELSYKMETICKFDAVKLHLDKLDDSAEAWRIQAQKYMEQGKYKDAVYSLQKAGADEAEIMKCRMFQCIREEKYVEMMQYALCLGEQEEARKYYDGLDKRTRLAKLIWLWLDPAGALHKGAVNPQMATKGIRECFPDMDDVWIEKIQLMYIHILSEYILKQLKDIREAKI